MGARQRAGLRHRQEHQDGRYIYANRAFERFSRFSRDHIIGKRANRIFRPDTAIFLLLESGLSPGRLELEIIEGVLIEDFDRGLALLRRPKALDVPISMDDFGSGYSSLSYLQAFPFDRIRLDQSRPQSAIGGDHLGRYRPRSRQGMSLVAEA